VIQALHNPDCCLDVFVRMQGAGAPAHPPRPGLPQAQRPWGGTPPDYQGPHPPTAAGPQGGPSTGGGSPPYTLSCLHGQRCNTQKQEMLLKGVWV
jgi:hypothetical protein